MKVELFHVLPTSQGRPSFQIPSENRGASGPPSDWDTPQHKGPQNQPCQAWTNSNAVVRKLLPFTKAVLGRRWGARARTVGSTELHPASVQMATPEPVHLNSGDSDYHSQHTCVPWAHRHCHQQPLEADLKGGTVHRVGRWVRVGRVWKCHPWVATEAQVGAQRPRATRRHPKQRGRWAAGSTPSGLGRAEGQTRSSCGSRSLPQGAGEGDSGKARGLLPGL